MFVELKTESGNEVNGLINYNQLIDILNCPQFVEITIKRHSNNIIDFDKNLNLQAQENLLIKQALDVSKTQKEAAKLLGVTQRVLCYKLKQLRSNIKKESVNNV